MQPSSPGGSAGKRSMPGFYLPICFFDAPFTLAVRSRYAPFTLAVRSLVSWQPGTGKMKRARTQVPDEYDQDTAA